ncbi:hypothetical protein JK621_24335 [Serratia plymuthica]|uniref:hypothetical protein n=1 Tax=Serratia plymuthica TaxID=82996 RepID=UPI001BAF8518|nr:hypothetical protein [Serratia plymuthica]QUY48458.1 hypothetical protein JK621_24335 [Serratia plymuthica]
MSYNQKAWLSILILCSVFWLVVIGSVFSVNEVLERTHQQSLEGLSAQTSHSYHATATSAHGLQARSQAL